LIYINDLSEFVSNFISKLYLYADDGKLHRHIISSTDIDLLQHDIYFMKSWLIKTKHQQISLSYCIH